MKAPRSAWVGLAVLALPTLLVTMDLSVLFLAVPKLTRDLQPTSSELLWITDVYGLFIAAFLITMGNLSDRIGHRRLLMIGGAAFALASLLAAFSTSATMLIAARAVLGIAGATLAPSSLALIRNLFEEDGERQFAIGIWISCFAAGAAIGPLLGGLLLEFFWWGSVFLPNVAVMALLLALGPRLLPESREPQPGPIDLSSVCLSLVGLLAFVYGLTRAAQSGFDVLVVVAIVAGLAIGTAFVRRQGKLADPLLELRLFRSATFSLAVVALLASVFVISGSDLFIAQYIQLVHSTSPLLAGVWLLPGVLGLIVGSMVAPRLLTAVPAGLVIAAGFGLTAVGLAVIGLLDVGSRLVILAIGTTLLGLGVGPIGTVGTDIVVAAAPPERGGAASAISETATELGGALGIAILGAIGAAVYRSRLSAHLPVSVSASESGTAHGSLGAATEVAANLPTAAGDVLASAARSAFTQGLNVAALSAAAMALSLAALAVLRLRGVRAEAEATAES